MPIYEFSCETCGPFERWRDHRESGEPMPCSSCKVTARRVYSMPDFNVSSRAGKRAQLLNEQGSSPGVAKSPQTGETTPTPKPQRVSGRPWQISH
ncbi:MAG: FmdB family zinc ribbon protein [Rubrobacteraceae bacterium]